MKILSLTWAPYIPTADADINADIFRFKLEIFECKSLDVKTLLFTITFFLFFVHAFSAIPAPARCTM